MHDKTCMIPIIVQAKKCLIHVIKAKAQIFIKDTISARQSDQTAQTPLLFSYEPRHKKTNILVSDQVQHKQGCTATEDG